jgi:hypothetical protein
MHSTDDLDMGSRDIVGPYYPPGIGPVAVCHAVLKKVFYHGDYGRSEKLTLKNLSTELPTCFMKRPSVI